MPKYPAAVTDATIATSDITTNNASTSKHGWLLKLDNNAAHFVNGQGAWATPAGGSVATDAIFDAKGDLPVGTGADTAAKLTVGTDSYELVADASQSSGLRWQNTSWTIVTKASDESVASSTTVQNDDELFFTAVSTAMYEIEVVLIYASPAGAATPDLKFDLGEDNTARGSFISFGLSTSDAASNSSGFLANQSTTGSHGTAAANRIARLIGLHQGAGGTFRVRWAQNTSDVSATIVRAGSLIRYRRVV